MNELPAGWAETTLSEISTLAPKSEWADDTEVGFVPMSHAPTNFRGGLRYEARPWHEVRKAYTHFENGDVIFAKVTPCFENGKAALVSGLPNDAGAGSSEFHVLRPRSPEISAGYLLALIKSAEFLREGQENMTGAVGLRRVPRAFVEHFPIRLPPATEQKRIAQKLGALLAQVDTLKARIATVPTLLKRFRTTALTALLSNSALQDSEDWSRSSVADLCAVAFDGPFGSKLKSDDYTDAGVRVVRLENIGHLYFVADKVTYVSFEKGRDLSNNKLLEGDILFSSFVDEEVRVCQLPQSKESFINKADCFCLRINPEVANAKFVTLALSTRDTYQRVRASVHGATRPRINLGFLKSFEIRLPTLDQQAEIVCRIEQLFAFADQLEARVGAAQKLIDALTQSLLAKAFRGELVPQDPDDEPASILLERIRAQRAATPKPKRGRKVTAN